jgi:hypothetical protein
MSTAQRAVPGERPTSLGSHARNKEHRDGAQAGIAGRTSAFCALYGMTGSRAVRCPEGGSVGGPVGAMEP